MSATQPAVRRTASVQRAVALRRAGAALVLSMLLGPLIGLVLSVAVASPSAVPRDPAGTGSAAGLGTGQQAAPTDKATTAGPDARTSSGPSTDRWAWPLAPNPAVLQRFVPPEHPWSPGHRGVDLAAVVGQSVLAPEAGVVTFSGSIAGRGVLVVAHSGGLRSTFEPVEGSLPAASPVERGQPVATVSATPGHCVPATCLHWGVLRSETYLDPLAMVGLLRVVLLPLT